MAKNTIKLRSELHLVDEFTPAEVLYPGHLIEINSNGNAQKHSSGGGPLAAMFAIEAGFAGYGIGDKYDPNGDNDKVQAWNAHSGDYAYAVLQDGQNVSKGDYLESAGDGTLTTYSSGVVVAQADEALDLSASSGTESSGTLGYDKRIKVRIVK